MAKSLVNISKRALIQRINRVLDKRGDVLKYNRSRFEEMGDYFVVNVKGNYVVEKDVDLVALGKELAVIQDYEKFEE